MQQANLGAAPRPFVPFQPAALIKPQAQTNLAGAPLRILFVTPRFFPFMGGVENHVYEVARRMAQENVLVTILTTDPSGELAPRETMENIEIIRVRAYPADRDFYWAPDLYKHITRGAWDIVHVQVSIGQET